MNLDLSATVTFGDVSGLRCFFLDHRFVHDQTANALTKKFNVPVSTTALISSIAEEAWETLMRNGQGATPQALTDWLQIHALIHDQTYELLGGEGTVAPDLSVVDFSKPTQFYDWMYVHQQMHDYEQASLGLS